MTVAPAVMLTITAMYRLMWKVEAIEQHAKHLLLVRISIWERPNGMGIKEKVRERAGLWMETKVEYIQIGSLNNYAKLLFANICHVAN